MATEANTISVVIVDGIVFSLYFGFFLNCYRICWSTRAVLTKLFFFVCLFVLNTLDRIDRFSEATAID